MKFKECLKPGGALLSVGDSFDADDGKRYECVQGSDGGVRLMFTGAGSSQASTSCKYNEENFALYQTKEIDGVTFVCNHTGERVEWSWQSGGECKLKDNSTIRMSETKLEGDVAYHCIARGLRIFISVKGTIQKEMKFL